MGIEFNCSGLSGAEELTCLQINILNTDTSLSCPGTLYYTDNGTCYNYTSPIQKAAGYLGDDNSIDYGNNAFMLASAALVFIMTPALGLFYAGLAGEETSGNTLMMSFATICVVTVQWWLFGYSFAFGPGNNGFGSFQWGALYAVGMAPSGAYGWNISHITWAVFQLMFAIITPAIISGGVVGRMKFTTFLLFVFIWTTCVYDTLAHWVWSFEVNEEGSAVALGWLGAKGSLDFAGGSVIHISSGFAALACALVLGKRYNYGEEVKPHNIPLCVLGGAFIWFGWFGFNAGSAAGAANTDGAAFDGDGNQLQINGLSATAFLNTHLAACAGSLTWMIMDKLIKKNVTPVGAVAGGIAGLVAITPAAGFVDVWTSMIFGLVVVPFCYFGSKIKVLLGIDDTLDAFSLHGIGGCVGAFMTGLFATTNINFADGAFYGNAVQLGYNCLDIVVAASFSFFCTLVLMLGLKYTVGVRIDEEAEKEGIDVSEHGGKSYAH